MENWKRIALQVFTGIYIAFGIYTEMGLMEVAPLSKDLFADYSIYEKAAENIVNGKDPYAERSIGVAFIYPPQSLLFFEALTHIKASFAKVGLFIFINVGLLIYMIYGIIKHYNLKQRNAWFLYPLGLAFAPFLELLHIGQVNELIEFGLFLTFAYSGQSALLAGIGLSEAILLKVTPVVFMLYLLITKKWRVIAISIGIIVVVSCLAWLRYGEDVFWSYFDVFRYITNQFPDFFASQSLFAIINRFVDIREYARILQTGLDIYLLLIMASSIVSYYIGQPGLFFVTLGLGITLTPNLIWYHHYVFLLLPLFILMCLSRLDARVVAWCLVGFIIIQLDRWYLTAGLLIHSFVHLTIVGLIVYQLYLAWNLYREKSAYTFNGNMIK